VPLEHCRPPWYSAALHAKVLAVANSLKRVADQEREHARPTVVSLNDRKQALVRDTIWEAAIDLFAEKGFDETTVDDIAAAAGTSRRSVFRYFASKSDFMALPIVSYGSLLIDSIEHCPATHTPAELLRYVLFAVAKESASNPRARKVMEIGEKYPEARQAQIARMAEVQVQVAEALSHRFKKTSKDRITAAVLAASIPSLLGVAFQVWYDRGQGDIKLTVDQVLASLSELACSESAVQRRVPHRK
jgi:AcrR family transcriptional regulator